MASVRMARLAIFALAVLAFLAVPADAGWLLTANTQVVTVGDTGVPGPAVTVPGGAQAQGVTFNVLTSNFYTTTSANQIVEYNASTLGIVNGPTSGAPFPLNVAAPAGTSNAGGGGGLALDAAGNVYVANSGTGNSILRFTPTLSGDTKFNQNLATTVFYIGVAFDKAGNLYATANNTSGNGQLYKFDPAGNLVPTFGTGGIVAGLNQAIGSVTVGPDGNLYVANSTANQIVRFDPITGASLGTFSSGNGLSSPDGLAFGADGNLYVANFGSGQVKEFNGVTGAFISNFSPPTGAYTNGPRFITFSTPEPGSLTLVALGSVVGCLGYWRRRKSQPEPEAATATEPVNTDVA